MKHLRYFFLTLALLTGFVSHGQTTLSGLSASGVSINAPAAAYDADYQAVLDIVELIKEYDQFIDYVPVADSAEVKTVEN